jgi:thiamine pyrophosphate-dependent acetolactate synthase large subunit-like protein
MAWSHAEDEVRDFIERTQIPFLRSPMGKGVMRDEHPLAVSAARTLALRNADVVFLMGPAGSCNLPPRYAPDVKVIQLDIVPRRSATTRRPRWLGRPTGWAMGPPEDRLWQSDPRLLRGDRAIERRPR